MQSLKIARWEDVRPGPAPPLRGTMRTRSPFRTGNRSWRERVDALTRDLAGRDREIEVERQWRNILERQLATLRGMGVEASEDRLIEASEADAAVLTRKEACEADLLRLEADMRQLQEESVREAQRRD